MGSSSLGSTAQFVSLSARLGSLSEGHTTTMNAATVTRTHHCALLARHTSPPQSPIARGVAVRRQRAKCYLQRPRRTNLETRPPPTKRNPPRQIRHTRVLAGGRPEERS